MRIFVNRPPPKQGSISVEEAQRRRFLRLLEFSSRTGFLFYSTLDTIGILGKIGALPKVNCGKLSKRANKCLSFGLLTTAFGEIEKLRQTRRDSAELLQLLEKSRQPPPTTKTPPKTAVLNCVKKDAALEKERCDSKRSEQVHIVTLAKITGDFMGAFNGSGIPQYFGVSIPDLLCATGGLFSAFQSVNTFRSAAKAKSH